MKSNMLGRILSCGVFVALVSFGGCYYDNEEALYPQLTDGCDTTNVTYAGSIVPILVANCYSCHSNANAPTFGDNIRLEAYADVQANLTRIYGAVSWSGSYSRMPKNSGKLPDCSIRMIELWIAQGAPNSIIATGEVK